MHSAAQSLTKRRKEEKEEGRRKAASHLHPRDGLHDLHAICTMHCSSPQALDHPLNRGKKRKEKREKEKKVSNLGVFR